MPFHPEVLLQLVALKREDPAAFEVLRAQLKRAGIRVTALDEAMAEESGDVGGRGPTQADTLIKLSVEAELFHAPDGTGFADLNITAIARPGPSAARAFAAGWRGGSSKPRRAHRTRRLCSRR